MKKGVSAKKKNKKKHVDYEILRDYGAECLGCDLVKLAKLGHHLVSLHVFADWAYKVDSRPTVTRDGEALNFEKPKSPAIQAFEDLNSMVCTGSLKDGNFSLDDGEMEVPLSSISVELPESLGWPLLHNQIYGTNIFPDREIENAAIKHQEITSTSPGCGWVQIFEDESVDGNKNTAVENYDLLCDSKEEFSSTSASIQEQELPQLKTGWPLLRVRPSMTLNYSRESEAESVVSLPDGLDIGIDSNRVETSVKREISCHEEKNVEKFLTATRNRPKGLELFDTLSLSKYKQFSYEELKEATSQFSSENLIGEGGCSYVYKGCLPDGKLVAVKLLKSYKEAWSDFSLEVDIVSSLNHKKITSLVGACVEDNYLILVYDLMSKGSLEEILHGHTQKSTLPWEVRFEVAVAIAEALCYLHNECSRPVIHRDVKSSNILLSNDLQPQLSDFGLAIWGPTDSTYLIHSDVVGTFGYIAPEYFMHGRVSNKMDVYSFGVVLLELLSGRRPISRDHRTGQEGLVKWAKTLLNDGDLKSLLDPELDESIVDDVEVHSMALAANLCIDQSARRRPKMSQILKLLRGEEDAKQRVESHINDLEDLDNWEDDDDFYSVYKPHLEDVATSLSKADTTSMSGTKQSHRLKLKDYLCEPQD
ncbi:Pkinase domain-containing protein [Cephalotus follicularis]|uniref:Pkinase domain-containing protein n=1 Tax=Cephalotus follicularis TaxID=3775 RepID=A0A1Q3ALU6_CEPFO|nr:Pkinase domain-containing protein [Cephalotus follicularis]